MKSAVPSGHCTPGEVVRFSTALGQKGVEAANVIQLANGSGGGCAGVGAPWGNGGVRPTSSAMAFAGQASPMNKPGQTFFGTVKAFNEEKGWGHITCANTQAMFGKDMFLLRSALA